MEESDVSDGSVVVGFGLEVEDLLFVVEDGDFLIDDEADVLVDFVDFAEFYAPCVDFVG